MRITNKLDLPTPLVQAVINEREDYKPDPLFPKGDSSVTKLLAPPRQVALIAAHKDEIVEDAADRVWALFGQLTHKLLEMAGVDDLGADHEYKCATTILDWRITGKIDRVFHQEGFINITLQDWKLTSGWSIVFGAPKDEWAKQLNLYRLLYEAMRPTDEVKKLEVVVFVRDWSKPEALRNSEYPQHQVQVIPIKLWDRDEALWYLGQRVQLHQEAQQAVDNGDEPALCTEEERWIRNKEFAVKKQGVKRAVRVFKTEEECKTFMYGNDMDGPGHFIEHRKTPPMRCALYCAAAPWCKQYQDELEAESE